MLAAVYGATQNCIWVSTTPVFGEMEFPSIVWTYGGFQVAVPMGALTFNVENTAMHVRRNLT